MEFPFDEQVKESDSVGKAVIHVWARPSFLPLGVSRTGPGDCALHQAPAGRLLVLRDPFSRTARGSGVHPRGGTAGPRAPSRILSGIWTAVAHSKGRDRHHR